MQVPYPPRSRRLTRADWLNRLGWFVTALMLALLSWEDIGEGERWVFVLGALCGFMTGRLLIRWRVARLERGDAPWWEDRSRPQRVLVSLAWVLVVAVAIVAGQKNELVRLALTGAGPGLFFAFGVDFLDAEWSRLAVRARRISAAAGQPYPRSTRPPADPPPSA